MVNTGLEDAPREPTRDGTAIAPGREGHRTVAQERVEPVGEHVERELDGEGDGEEHVEVVERAAEDGGRAVVAPELLHDLRFRGVDDEVLRIAGTGRSVSGGSGSARTRTLRIIDSPQISAGIRRLESKQNRVLFGRPFGAF